MSDGGVKTFTTAFLTAKAGKQQTKISQ